MKLLRKVVAYTISTAMLITGLSGCVNKPAANMNNKSVELSIFGWSFDRAAESDDAPVYKALKDKLNITIKPVVANSNNWEEKLNVIIASGEMPDIFMSRGVIERPENFSTWIKEKMIVPISDYAEGYPNLNNALKNFDDLKKMQGGKHYALPVAKYGTATDVTADHYLWIRKDWLDKLGLEMPKTINDFYNVAKAFAERDPDGNGIKDTYGYTTSNSLWSAAYIINCFNTSFKQKRKVGNEWVAECTTNEMKDAIRFMKKMYDEKILDPEFVINTDDKMTEKFISGKAGMMHRNGEKFYKGYYDKFKKAYPNNDPESMFTWAPVLEGKQGIKRLDGKPNFWCMTTISTSASDEKRKKAMELLDYLLSDEGKMLTRYGIEGVHYKKEGENIINIIPPNDKSGYLTIDEVDPTARFKYLVQWDTDFIPEGMPHRDKIIGTIKTNETNYIFKDPLRYLVIKDEWKDETKAKQLEDFMMETFVKLVIKSNNFDEEWDSYVKKWNDMGGKRYMEIISQSAMEQGY